MKKREVSFYAVSGNGKKIKITFRKVVKRNKKTKK